MTFHAESHHCRALSRTISDTARRVGVGITALLILSLLTDSLDAKPLKLRRAVNSGRILAPAQFEPVLPAPNEVEMASEAEVAPSPRELATSTSEPIVHPNTYAAPSYATPPVAPTHVQHRYTPTYTYRPGWWRTSCAGPGVTPIGESIWSPFAAQIANGHAGRLVLYRYDFVNDESKDMSTLSYTGIRKLSRLMPAFRCTGFPLKIERIPGREDLSELRRMHVLERISVMAGIPVSDQRVIVSDVDRGLQGYEALLIHQTMQGVTRSSGSSGGPSGSGQSGQSQSGLEIGGSSR